MSCISKKTYRMRMRILMSLKGLKVMSKVMLKIILILQKLSRLLLGPDMRKEAWCRLCLTKRNVPPLLDLSQNAYLASLITKVLCLRVSLSCNTSKPCHVCHACHDTIQTFVTLRDLALKNEEIFIKSTESQKSILNKEEIRNQVKVELETFSGLEAGDFSFGTFLFRQLWMLTLMFYMIMD